MASRVPRWASRSEKVVHLSLLIYVVINVYDAQQVAMRVTG